MGKHGTEHERVKQDRYPTIDPRAIGALAEYLDFKNRDVWEFAAGKGDMVRALRAAGARRVHPMKQEAVDAVREQVIEMMAERYLERFGRAANEIATKKKVPVT
jgi:hypothetical protein